MLIVSGRLYLKAGAMKKFLASSFEAIALARKSPGCHDFVVAADPLEPDRVNVYEEWESEDALLKFRGDGPNSDMWSAIVSAEVFRHVISSTGPA
ncbi:MAG TPA: antibiotic biosynthesis monooxygenase family protein [Pseudolabrys sp.]|nr:antibiotic biosynthesis monooxygenase family protein [Pseudolabrys sp.]